MPPIALPRWQRRTLYAVVVLLVASGIGWLLTAWRADPEAMSAAARALSVWCLRVHGIAAYAALVIVGGLLPMHARSAWQRRRNRWSGALLSTLLLLLAATGLWLYYGPEAGRDLVSAWHWVVGLVLPVWLLLHRHWGLKARRG